MFAHLAVQDDHRAAALVPIAEDGEACANTFNRQRGMAIVFRTAGRTIGTCTGKIQQSFDGGTTWVDTEYTATLTNNGDQVIFITRAIPTYLRFPLTPAAAFDGTIAIFVRSSDLIAC